MIHNQCTKKSARNNFTYFKTNTICRPTLFAYSLFALTRFRPGIMRSSFHEAWCPACVAYPERATRWAVSRDETGRKDRLTIIERTTSWKGVRNLHNDYANIHCCWLAALQITRRSVLFSYSSSIGRIPIYSRKCCCLQYCRRVSESVRRALVFGALWQHHGLHDYFFVQTHDQRGICREQSWTKFFFFLKEEKKRRILSQEHTISKTERTTS